MIRRKTINHWLIVCIVCILGAAALLLVRHIMVSDAANDAANEQQTTTAAASSDENTETSGSALQKGPFYLKITTSRFGEQTYQSFEIYFTNSESGDAIFSCGRKFASDEVLSIGWSGDSYDVIVRLRSGASVTYPYDGISTWQQ